MHWIAGGVSGLHCASPGLQDLRYGRKCAAFYRYISGAVMRRALFNSLTDIAGITALRWHRRPAGLYCFNLHRVGNDDGTAFHPNLFSCTGERFTEIVRALRANFDMIGLDRVLEMVATGEVPDRRYALLTFDDGYIDNYEVAFEVLRREGCSAVFFLPTNFIDGQGVPWWDRIAWRVAHLGNGELRVPGCEMPINVSRDDLEGSIRRVLRVVKDSSDIPMDAKVAAIENQVDCPNFEESGRQLFISWEQVREMRKAGMWFGSHTRSHQILSHLSEADQLAELSDSKRVLEERIGERIDALAYPVGGRDSYTEITRQAAASCGYKVAFNFVGGVNRNPAVRRYELLRIAIDENMDFATLKRAVGRAPQG